MQKYWNLCCSEQWSGGIFWSVEPQDDRLRLRADAFVGTAFLPPLDSGEDGFRWGRIKLDAEIPDESAVKVYARASDDSEWKEWSLLAEREQMPGAAQELFGDPDASGDDLWLRERGRYIWLAVELVGGGAKKPCVNAIRLLIGGDHMTDYLPAIYQQQDFTYRYLSIFTAMEQDLEEKIEKVERQLDPMNASGEMLRYLALWLCADRGEGDRELRNRLPGVLEEYETMYTPRGIARSARRLSGELPWIIEHFSVDPNDPSCKNPELYRRLYGDDPYRFFLLLPQGAFTEQRQMEDFIEQMEELIPAETEMELILLKPCVQLDWHTYLGLNSRIGNYVPAVIDESVTIHYDTTIGGTDHER